MKAYWGVEDSMNYVRR